MAAAWLRNVLANDQRYYGRYFDCYRTGAEFDPNDPAINTRTLPSTVILDAYNAANNQQLRADRGARITANEFDRVERPRFNVRENVARRDPADVAAALVNLQALDARFGNNIKFVKTLGIGGFGIASLWQWTDANGVHRGRSVVKTVLVDTNNPGSTQAQEAMTRERTKTIELARAQHIVQRFHIGNFLGAQGLALDNDPSILITELARKKDLDVLLNTVGRLIFKPHRPRRTGITNRYNMEEDDQKIPKAVIWQIFDCLLTACISMAYPPRSQEPPAMATTAAEIGPPIVEQIPAPAVHVNKRDIVHFDLTPENIFLFGTDANHLDIPVFKAADLGLAHTPDETRDDVPPQGPRYSISQTRTIWGSRILGKDGWHLPEQFCVDWNRVVRLKDPFSQGFPGNAISRILDPNTSAGNYSDWSNIWQMGMVLFGCMTLRFPYLPPMAAQDPQIQNVWTYGSEIEGQHYRTFYGDELCGLVARCLAVMPIDRPTLQGLRTSLDNLKPANLTEEDKSWVRRFTRSPSAPKTSSVDDAFG